MGFLFSSMLKNAHLLRCRCASVPHVLLKYAPVRFSRRLASGIFERELIETFYKTWRVKDAIRSVGITTDVVFHVKSPLFWQVGFSSVLAAGDAFLAVFCSLTGGP